ncbi:exosortase C-terminal domain/associated protein EpsI [Thermodesulfobacteriota bacterium]
MLIKSHIKFIITIIVLFICLVFIYQKVLLSKDLDNLPTYEFPSSIGDWHSKDVKYDSDVLSVLATDQIVYKEFSNGKTEPPITLFIGYYGTLEKADSSHSPVVCFTGQGWAIEDTEKHEIKLGFPEYHNIKVNHMVQKKLDTTLITLYWYQTADKAFSNRAIQKLNMYLDKMTGKGEKNAFVRVTTTIPKDKKIDEITTIMSAFVTKLTPELIKYLQ